MSCTQRCGPYCCFRSSLTQLYGIINMSVLLPHYSQSRPWPSAKALRVRGLRWRSAEAVWLPRLPCLHPFVGHSLLFTLYDSFPALHASRPADGLIIKQFDLRSLFAPEMLQRYAPKVATESAVQPPVRCIKAYHLVGTHCRATGLSQQKRTHDSWLNRRICIEVLRM